MKQGDSPSNDRAPNSAAKTTVPPPSAPTTAPAPPPPVEPPDADPHHPPLPRIDGYRLLREMGRGGQAVVFEAIQLSTTRHVAIKVLTGGRFAAREDERRLEREARVLASVEHPNVVQIIDLGTTPDGLFYLVMQYVSGRTLSEWLDRRKHSLATGAHARRSNEPLRVFLKICNAVNAAHLRGIVHRDLKPGNILVDDDGEPHVLDFGLARAGLSHLADGGGGAAPTTMTGDFFGSLPWASPEQADGIGEHIDVRSDVYSLGVILYQLLTGGHFPYAVAGSMREVLDNILKAPPRPPSVDPALDAIALKALAKQRRDRYQTAGELARDVERFLDGQPVGAAGGAERPRRAAPRLTSALAALLLVSAGVATVIVVPLARRERTAAPAAPTTRTPTTRAPTTRAPTTSEVSTVPRERIFEAGPYVQPPGRVVELLPHLDLEKDEIANRGFYRLSNGELVITFTGSHANWTSYYLPCEVPEEYDYLIEYTPGPSATLTQHLPNPQVAGFVSWSMGYGFAGFGRIDGKRHNDEGNPTRVRIGPALNPGARHVSVVQMRRDGVRAYVDGRFYSDWPTDFFTLVSSSFSNRRQTRPQIHTPGDLTIHRVAIIEVTGTGRLLSGTPDPAK